MSLLNLIRKVYFHEEKGKTRKRCHACFIQMNFMLNYASPIKALVRAVLFDIYRILAFFMLIEILLQ